MLSKGLLEVRWEKSQLGPRKKVYRLARNWKGELDMIFLDAIGTVHSYEEYVLSLPPKFNNLNSVSAYLSRGLKGEGIIV